MIACRLLRAGSSIRALCLLLLITLSHCVLWQTQLAAAATIEEIQQLADATSDNIIPLDDKTFPKYVEEPRDYSVVVVFSVRSNAFQCDPCIRFEPIYQLIASSWRKMGQPKPLYFAYVDFGNGRHTFGKYSITSAPAALYMHPTAGPNASKADPAVYDFVRHGISEDDFAEFVGSSMGTQMVIYRPIDWKKHAITLAGLVALLVTLRYTSTHLLSLVSNARLWSAVTLVVILMMMSGFMWNQIRTPAFQGGSPQNPQYIDQGFQRQFVVETQIIAVLYGACAFATVSLVTRVPKIQNRTLQQVIALVWAIVIIAVYSTLLKVFRIKSGGYPFKLLF